MISVSMSVQQARILERQLTIYAGASRISSFCYGSIQCFLTDATLHLQWSIGGDLSEDWIFSSTQYLFVYI